jgi:hypothetical protein
MNKMILYKEWLKTRWVLLGIVLVMAAITFYCFLNLTKVVQIRGAEILWETLVSKETVLTEIFRYVPAAAAALLALSQWLPEMQHKRLKLTLHLPYPQGRMILTIAAYGLVILTVLYALQACCSALVFAQWIPAELIARIVRTMAVWYLAGWAAYLFTSALCLEPTWRFRVPILLVSAGLLRILYLSGIPEAYNGFFWILLPYVIASGSLLFLSVSRFKEGYQD